VAISSLENVLRFQYCKREVSQMISVLGTMFFLGAGSNNLEYRECFSHADLIFFLFFFSFWYRSGESTGINAISKTENRKQKTVCNDDQQPEDTLQHIRY
jgi:hypothetical protein